MKNLIIVFVLILNINTFAANIIYSPKTAKTDETTSVTPQSVYNEQVENMGPAASGVDSEESYQSSSTISDKTYSILEKDNNLYCYENNIPVSNVWCMVDKHIFSQFAPTDNFEGDYIWAYFGAGGKAVKGSSGSFKKVKIDGKYYAFNEYGQMLCGFFNNSADMWLERDNEDPFDLISSGDNLYHADEKTGELTTGWYKFNGTTSRYENKNTIWMYFNPSNHRAVRTTGNEFKSMTIDGKTYGFDDNGVMLTGFEGMAYNESHGGSTSKQVYFADDGAEVKAGFVSVNLDDETIEERYDESYEDVTIYLNKSGKMYKDTINNVNGSYYGFDPNGAVVKGLSVWRDGKYIATIDTESTDGKKFATSGYYVKKDGSSGSLSSNDVVIYFDKVDGKRKTSVTSIEFSDENYGFAGSNSGGYNGSHSGKFYANGLLMKPAEDKYGFYIISPTKSSYSMQEICGNSSVYVINKSGSRQTSSSALKDDDDNYILLDSSGYFINIYTVPVKRNGGSYYFKSTKSGGGEDWIPFGTKDSRGKTCKTGYGTDYQAHISSSMALNFYLN